VQPDIHRIALSGLHQGGHHAGVQVQAVELVGLVAAGRTLEDDVAAVARVVAAHPHRIGKVGQRFRLGHRAAQAVELRRAGARGTVADQHLAPVGVPVHEAVAAELGVLLDGLDQAHRHRRDALHHQVGVGRQHALVGGGQRTAGAGQERGDQAQGGRRVAHGVDA
jgi:hypothetical protein